MSLLFCLVSTLLFFTAEIRASYPKVKILGRPKFTKANERLTVSCVDGSLLSDVGSQNDLIFIAPQQSFVKELHIVSCIVTESLLNRVLGEIDDNLQVQSIVFKFCYFTNLHSVAMVLKKFIKLHDFQMIKCESENDSLLSLMLALPPCLVSFHLKQVLLSNGKPMTLYALGFEKLSQLQHISLCKMGIGASDKVLISLLQKRNNLSFVDLRDNDVQGVGEFSENVRCLIGNTIKEFEI